MSWFAEAGRALLSAYGVGLVAADPACSHDEPLPTGQVRYFRLHGEPRMDYSPYPDGDLSAMAERVAADGGEVWCDFDNTASHAAWEDAQKLRRSLSRDVAAPGSDS